MIEPILHVLRDRTAEVERARRELALRAGLTIVIEMTAEDDLSLDDDDPPDQCTWSVSNPSGSGISAEHLEELAKLGVQLCVSHYVFLPDTFPQVARSG